MRLLLVLLLTGAVAYAQPQDQGITTSHGFATFGELKYPADFQHFDYVNPDAPKGGVYTVANVGTFDSFNTYALTGTPIFSMIWVFDRLMERSLDEPGSFYGLIAETISYPSDLSWIEFKLRPEARWHDGKPITVDDVLYTVDLFKRYKHPIFGRSLAQVVRIDQTGPNSVRFHLAQPNNRALVAGVAQSPVLPRHYYETRDISAPSLDIPVGSGPYRIGPFSPGRAVDMVRVPDYWGRDLPVNRGRWNFDVLRNDFYRDQGVINEAFLSGNMDLRMEANATRWSFEATLAPFEKGLIKRATVPYDNPSFLTIMWMNTRRPFFQDVRVRKAMDLAYDFEWMQRVLLQGPHGRLNSYFDNTEYEAEGRPTAGELKLLEPFKATLPAELFTSPPPEPIGGNRANQRRNLLEAAALLKEAGYRIRKGKLVDPKTGEPVVLDFVVGSPTNERQIALFQQNLKRLGIDSNIQIRDPAQMRFVVRESNFDFTISIPFPLLFGSNPGFDLLGTLGSEGARTPGSTNIAGISEPSVDALLMTAITAPDRQTMIDASRAVDRVLRWKHYGIFFYHLYPAPVGELPIAYWDRFGRPPAEPTYNFPILTMDHWWIDKAKDARIKRALGKRG
jgi:microcin C transport system substrate-binding protein